MSRFLAFCTAGLSACGWIPERTAPYHQVHINEATTFGEAMADSIALFEAERKGVRWTFSGSEVEVPIHMAKGQAPHFYFRGEEQVIPLGTYRVVTPESPVSVSGNVILYFRADDLVSRHWNRMLSLGASPRWALVVTTGELVADPFVEPVEITE